MRLLRQLRALFRRKTLDADLADELRAPRGGLWLEQFAQDFRLGLRALAKAPGFSLVAIGTLALGIGACTAVYSVVDGLLLHPIGHDPHTEREVQIYETRLPQLPSSRVAPANFYDWQRRLTSFSSMRAGTGGRLLLTGDGEPLWLSAGRATHQLLEPHAWPLALGRGFLPAEDRPGQNRVVIVSYGLWQRLFGGDPAALGRTLQIEGEPHTVIGVIAEEVGRFSRVDAWVPLALSDADRAQRGTRSLSVWARLKPGVTLEQARAEINLLAAQLAQQHPDTNAGWGVAIVPVTEQQGGGGLREALWTLLGAVGCVLLIACANVANLLLARASGRQREMAVRAALGASRARIVRQLLTESLLLALLGGAAGVLLAHWALQAVHAYATLRMPRLAYMELNGSVLAGAVAASAATGLIFGLAPAWFAAKADVNLALKQSARGIDRGARAFLRGALVVSEVALAIVLLAGAAALIRRLVERAEHDPGFAAENVAAMQVNLVPKKYPTPAEQVMFVDAVCARLRAAAGVQSAGVTTALPVFQSGPRFEVEGRPARPRDEWPVTAVYAVTPDYFSTMGIRVLRGRAFTGADDARAPRVALINETLARQNFPRENPLGRRLLLASGKADEACEIVGVVNDVTQFGNAADTAVTPQCYQPFAQRPAANFSFVVRARGDLAAIQTALKSQVYAVDREQPVSLVQTMQEVVDERLDGARFAMHLLAVFSAVALLIAAIGLYGVIAYAMSQRTVEIGIRMALGAQVGDVRRLVLGFAGRLVGLGLVAGIAGAFAASQILESMLYHASVRDPLTLAAVGALLGLVALLAAWLPARRAARIDPMVALRCE